ncbi:PAS/PAC sensor signal transduction histidine kinase [Rhodoferax ferrireducens T118]|uniref:histidine kinase n=1 Tax=Albidiferax ferrireducens (strain ATCC BAA-621 / DSM 15236 / T118) TaxID=338969 RepID=Q21X00_ALBFT|nr:ATP-binding protein [Rhodoferax ferrireducens]ABD69703.1 PAS/PAC sensor signal transduction histidine kinase [Rhodoferax ferrireducens T118]
MNALARLMLDNSPEMVLLVNPATLQIMMANASVVKTLGYSLAQLQGLAITEIESALQDVFYWEDVRTGQCLEVQSQEGQYRCAQGELLTVSKSIRLLDQDGAPLLLVQAVQTRNERKAEDALAQTLSQLRATLESTGNGILVIGWQGRIESMNRLFGKMWEISDDLLDSHDDARILGFVAGRVIESGLLHARLGAIVDKRETEDLLHHQDGRVFEVSSRPQYLGEQIIGRVFGFQDITQRTLAEAALRESRDLLEQRVRSRTADLNTANETLQQEKERQAILIKRLEEAQNQLLQSERMASIGQLAAGVAHEINNPVGFVNSNLGSLQRYVTDMLRLLSVYEKAEGALPGAATQEINQVKADIDVEFLREDVANLLVESLDGLKRVTRIVQDLKDFSHVDESERQWADLEAGLESTLRVVWNELKYKAEVIKEFAGIPQVECFAFQLNQVFMNLLINASHAIEGRGTIAIRTGHDDACVWVEVQDSGRGIQPEHLSRIFEPFFTTKPVGQGTGLGLSLAYGIVKKHDGRIEVKSELGQGTVFRVILPKKTKTL